MKAPGEIFIFSWLHCGTKEQVIYFWICHCYFLCNCTATALEMSHLISADLNNKCGIVSLRYWKKWFIFKKWNKLFHLQTVHGGVFRGEAEKSPKKMETSTFSDKTKPVNEACIKGRESPAAQKSSAGVSMKNAGWTCGECLLWVPDRETYVNHMKTIHGKVRSFAVHVGFWICDPKSSHLNVPVFCSW